MMSMPKGATLVNTARKEVIDEVGLEAAMTERTDLKYVTDIAPDDVATMTAMFGNRFFATPKKMGAETAEANINAGLAAARQVVGYLRDGITKFQVNKVLYNPYIQYVKHCNIRRDNAQAVAVGPKRAFCAS